MNQSITFILFYTFFLSNQPFIQIKIINISQKRVFLGTIYNLDSIREKIWFKKKLDKHFDAFENLFQSYWKLEIFYKYN